MLVVIGDLLGVGDSDSRGDGDAGGKVWWRGYLSATSKDRKWAGRLHQWLLAAGHEVFLAQDLRDGIAGGEQWRPRLHERLRWADAVVCVVTSASVASTWCTAEVGIALSRGSRLLPVRAEPGVVHPLLKSAQYADLTVDSAVGRGALVEAGQEVFLDQNPRDGIALGEPWRQRLQERLRWADAVVCVVTSTIWRPPGVRPRSQRPRHGAAGYCRCTLSQVSPIRC